MSFPTRFSARIAEVQQLQDDTMCLTVVLAGLQRPWFGDEVDLLDGSRTIGRFRISGMAIAVGASDAETVMRLMSTCPSARAARPGHKLSAR